MITNNTNGPDSNSDPNIKKRVENIGEYTANALLVNLASQCYTFFKARMYDVSSEEFIGIINQVIFGEGRPIEYIVYDDDSGTYWILDIPEFAKLNITSVHRGTQPNLFDFPEYNISLRFSAKYEKRGTAEDLYSLTSPEIFDLFQRGWEEISAPNVRPCGMLTPHDLCSYVNFMETMDRLIWFMLYVLSSSDVQTGIMVPGHIVTDCYTMMSVELFISMAASTISRCIKLPTDMLPFKAYLVRVWVNFHLGKFQQTGLGPLQSILEAYLKGSGIDMKDVRLIPLTKKPNITFALFTSVVQKMPNR